jgi:hypothetical protein
MGLDTKTYWLTDWLTGWLTDLQSQCDFDFDSSVQFSVGDSDGKFVVEELEAACDDLTCELKTRFVIITVILRVLQLFVVTISEDRRNRFTNPDSRLSHCDTWQYVPAVSTL